MAWLGPQDPRSPPLSLLQVLAEGLGARRRSHTHIPNPPHVSRQHDLQGPSPSRGPPSPRPTPSPPESRAQSRAAPSFEFQAGFISLTNICFCKWQMIAAQRPGCGGAWAGGTWARVCGQSMNRLRSLFDPHLANLRIQPAPLQWHHTDRFTLTHLRQKLQPHGPLIRDLLAARMNFIEIF